MKNFILAWLLTLSYCLGHAQEATFVITPENLSSFSELSQWQGAEEGVNRLAFNPRSFEIVTINGDVGVGQGPVVFVDLSTNEILRELPDSNAFAFSNDGELFASINQDEMITVYETTDFNIIETINIETNDEPVMNMVISPDKQYIAVGIGGSVLTPLAQSVFILLDLDTGIEVFRIDRETDSMTEFFATGLIFSEDSDFVFLGISDGLIYQWNITTQEYQIIGEDGAYSSRILVRLYDDRLAYLTEKGFSIIDTDTHTEDFSISISDDPAILVAAIAAHPSQPLLVVSYLDLDTRETFLQIWNTETIELVFESIVGESGFLRVLDIAFSPDGTLLATSGADGVVRIWGIPADE